MRLIKPSFEIIEQGAGLDGIYKQIELAGRTCYKSTDKITEDSAKGFVERMVKSGHGAMLEHGTVYLSIPYDEAEGSAEYYYGQDPYSMMCCDIRNYYITTNYRVLVENGWLDDLKYICEPTEHHEKRVTVKFVCDRGVSHEFVRHRVFSFAQESTRYCNYSKDKFDKNLTFILPPWVNLPEKSYTTDSWGCPVKPVEPYADFMYGLGASEVTYMRLIKRGWKPQEARAILPNAIKTELVMTGFVSDWNHFFDLRARGTTGAPHPQAKELAEPLMEEFYKRNLIK